MTIKRFFPYFALATSILMLTFSAFFVRWAKAPAPVMGFYRIGIAALILTPIFLWRWRAGKVKLDQRALIFPLAGGFMSALDHFLWNTSLSHTSVANSTLLGNTSPLWVALFTWLVLRQHLRGKFWFGLALVLGGATFVVGSDFLLHPTFGWGDALAIGSSFFYAGYYLFIQRSRASLDTITCIWLACLGASTTLLAICLITGSALTGYSTQSYLSFLGAAIGPQVVGYLAMGYALGHIRAAIVAPTMLAQPVITALLAIPLLGEMLSPYQLIGGLVVLSGIYLINRDESRSTPPGAP